MIFMKKQMNKVRDMKHAKYTRFIKGDEIRLRRIALMYSDLNPNLREETAYNGHGYLEKTGSYILVFRVEMSMWNEMVRCLGLKCDTKVRQKRMWEIV
jgi:hypothetical protein